MSDLISIIIPVYNAEKYLPRTIEAVLKQTYRNIELILINDESPDNSAEVCKKYAALDSRVRYYEQSNHGQGYTRARGINLAKGDYVAFVDNDDIMQPNMYEVMLDAIHRDNSNVCACQWNYKLPNGDNTIDNNIYPESFYGIKTGIEFARYLYENKDVESGGYGYSNGLVVSPWNKLFKRDLLLGFKCTGYYGEEEEMNDYVYSQLHVKVSVIPDELYYWCQNLESASNLPFSERRWYFFKMLDKRTKLYTDRYILGETRKLICNLYIEYFFKNKKISSTIPEFATQIFRENCKALRRMKYCGSKFHLRMSLFSHSPNLYAKLLKLR